MSDFRGVPGGDPSRRPAKVTVEFSCKNCSAVQQAETRTPHKYKAPDYCSGECKNESVIKVVQELIEARGYTTSLNWRAALVFSILYNKKSALLSKLREDPELVQRGKFALRMFPCQQCGTSFSRVVETRISVNPRYCSEACRGSGRAELPFGLICQSPDKKMIKDSRAEMETELLRVNKELADEGDAEGLIAYSCTCGKWHAGHDSRREWDGHSRVLMEDLDRELDGFVIANMSKGNLSRWNKQKKDALLGRMTFAHAA